MPPSTLQVQWSSGYDFCFTRRRSPVRSWIGPLLAFFRFKSFLSSLNLVRIVFFNHPCFLTSSRVFPSVLIGHHPHSFMELPQLPLDAYVALCLVIATPWLYRTFSSKSSADQALSALLLLHTLYILHALFVSPPQNIFKTLGLHLTASPEALRAGVAELYGGGQNVPQHLDTLLKKLGLMDLRMIYIRCVQPLTIVCHSGIRTSSFQGSGTRSLPPARTANHSMILRYTRSLALCWSIFAKLHSLGYIVLHFHAPFRDYSQFRL